MEMSQYQRFIALSRYARWRPELGRRETWEETVARYFDFFEAVADERGVRIDRPYLESMVRGLDVLPSMRALMTAGPALGRDHIAGYNCAYTAIDDPRSFDEIMYILMCGSGVGFSVERQYVSKLPTVPEELRTSSIVIEVEDSRAGWARGLRQLIGLLYAGEVPEWDTSRVRPAGAKLRTFGGRASGPGPLEELFRFTIDLFGEAVGRKLTSLECHDLVCKIGEVVVAGGVRRSALISLSNLSDQRMRDAKSGKWWERYGHRALANNSVAYTERPEVGQFMSEWQALYASKSGERGIFNREATAKQIPARREANRPDGQPWDWGVNPCSEIILRPDQFCNLSEVVCRREDTKRSLVEKVRVAAVLGTLQACLTDFRYIRASWRDNCEEERLLGVSLTGIMDCPLLNGEHGRGATVGVLKEMKEAAVEMNRWMAEQLSINPAAAITCVKPSGTVSQLADCSSGIHARHSPYYIRRVRNDAKDPISQLMVEQGFPHEVDVTNPNVLVFEFPIRSPEGAVLRDHRSAIEELDHWLLFQEHWCEHKPSVTVTVRENEWPAVGAWVWDHFDAMSGVSFLPHSGHTYRQAPYEEVDEARLMQLEARMPLGEWGDLSFYEKDDETKGSQELACVAGACEVV